jgi:hypothetical protein
MTKLAERTVLAALHIGVWSGNAVDREVTTEVSESHKADVREAGRYSKKLVAAKFLHPVSSVVNNGRQVHRTLTLPWDDDGTRILSTTGYEQYTQQMRLIRQKFESVVKNFIGGLPECIKEAETRLGTMFSAADYPSSDDIKAKFGFDVEIKNVNDAGDFRAQLSDATVKAIQKDIERRANSRVENAMRDVYQRVFDVSHKMATKLAEYDPASSEGRFKDSLVYNVHELTELLPLLNITDDPKLTELQGKLRRELVEYSPEILRADPKARSETQRRAEAIAKKAKQFLG